MPNVIALFIAVFLASAVEAVEAVTVVLAAGTARGFRSAGRGTIAALLTLALLVIVAGPVIGLLPMELLRLVIGGLGLVFGLQWLRKAILRYSGYKAIHDEDEIFKQEFAAARAAEKKTRFGVDDWYAFTMAFKIVLLEGLEVVFIVVTFGTIQHSVPTAALGGLAAVILVSIFGFAARKPLSRVPENTLKFAVGIILSAFGTFWAAEGVGVKWPGSDLAILALIVFYLVSSYLLIVTLRRRKSRSSRPSQVVQSSEPSEEVALEVANEPRQSVVATLKKFGEFWYDFIFGDDWRVAAIVVLGLAITTVNAGFWFAFLLLPVAVITATGVSTLKSSH